MHTRVVAARVLALAGLTTLLFGCSPSLSPLYRDYRVQRAQTDVYEDVRLALADAGWKPDSSVVDNVVATQERTIRRWGLYTVRVSLEAAPMDAGVVRVLFHPYRVYFTGRRSKILFFKGGLRRAILKDLNHAFARQGLKMIDVDREELRLAAG